ncbi:MAG: hypothetical protein MMC23_001338, partial [Stictis urceolatum]|nr:hypothetical protein [Stictis urceolata]
MAKPATHREHHSEKSHRNRAVAHLFVPLVLLFFALFDWPLRWLLSGAPFLTYVLLLGDSNGYRVLPFATTWTLVTTLNLAYAVSATSWLLYWFFVAACYPALFLTCVFQFGAIARPVRRALRSLLKQVDFVNDTVAYFDLPALEIDTDVGGLFVIRGLTISLSNLTIIAHGVEVGIKLSDDMELALQVNKTVVSLFRKIEVGDVYAHLKGGQYEMTFGQLTEDTRDASGNPLMESDTPLLKAAASWKLEGTSKVPMQTHMTGGKELKDNSLGGGLAAVTSLSPDDASARERYEKALSGIEKTSHIRQSEEITRMLSQGADQKGPNAIDWEDDKVMRAAVCSQLHDQPSVPHAPNRSIKVTTLQNLSSPKMQRFLHRLPMLLRLLLNPISYFHPVYIASITASGSGSWIQHMLRTAVFKDYGDDSSALRNLETRIFSWLSDANFVVQMVDIRGLAAVPFLTGFDITANLKLGDVIVHRTLPQEIKLRQVARLGGADAAIYLPSFLLPHHEHLLPPKPTERDKRTKAEDVEQADGKPKTFQAQQRLEHTLKDETEMTVSAHARLPAVFDHEVLEFVAALVKATKIIEMEKEPSALGSESRGVKEWSRAVRSDMKDGIKKMTVDGMVNDRWIAKMVGKVMKKLEAAQGDLGYSGTVPIALEYYRAIAEPA